MGCIFALGVSTGSASAQRPVPRPPSIDNLGKRPVPPIRDATGGSRISRARARQLKASTNRRSYRAYTGEEVNVVLSNAFVQNDAYKQHWANFFASLLHGFELPYATIYLASAAEKNAVCGADSDACYWGSGAPWPETLVINLQPPAALAPFTEELAAHEYGHHITWNRDNRPWDAFDHGPKRWASYEGVCPRTRAGLAFPGDEGQNYHLNPGEAFSEHYRVTTGGNVNVSTDIDNSFYPPDSGDLRVVREDVLRPWGRNTVRRWRGRLRGRRKQTSKVFGTPLDGTIRVTVGGVRGSDFDLFLKVGRRTVKRGTRTGGDSFTYRVCGPARVRVVVKRHSGRAKGFRVRFSRP